MTGCTRYSSLHILCVTDSLHNNPFVHGNITLLRTDLISSFEQKFSRGEPAKNVLDDETHWGLSFPHENSGPCYTYNPLHKSDPELQVGMYIVMKDESWDPTLEIFLHSADELYYSHTLVWDWFLSAKTLRKERLHHPRLKRKYFTYR